jgi:NADPH:quinone reductase
MNNMIICVMKALVIRSFGGPEVLEVLDWPEPEVGPHDVLIAVRAVSVGRTLDVEVRARGADFRVTLPRIPGADPAGVVTAIGDRVTGLSVGDRVAATSTLFCGECAPCRQGRTHACLDQRVLGVHVDGGAAEYCAVPETSVVRIPNHVTFEQAAVMAVNYPMAWNLLRYAGGVGAGDDVLVMAAGGGLGIAGIAVAKALGARVIAAAGSRWKLDRCRDLLGVEALVDYSRPGWSRQVRELSADGRGVSVVFENISSPELFGESLASLREHGRLVTCGAHGGGTVAVDIRALYRRHLSIVGESSASAEMTREVWQLVAERRVDPPPVFHRFALSEAAAAHAAAAGRETFGRVVLLIGRDHVDEPFGPDWGGVTTDEPLPENRAQLLALVDAMWSRLGGVLDRLGDRLTQPVLEGGWSPRDIVSHIRLYEAWLLGALDPERREAQEPYWSYLTERAQIAERNGVHTERDRALPLAQLMAAAAETHAELRAALAELRDDQLAVPHTVRDGRLVPSPDGRPLADLVAIETYRHYREHAHQLDSVV